MIWVKKIEDPSAFGVVQLDEKNVIIDFVEKPKEFISDLAMIGIYFFKNGATLKTELDYLLENDLQKGGEYQLPDALRRLTEKGTVFMPGQVDAWLDCGNKKVTVETNKHVLNFDQERGVNLRHSTAEVKNSIVIEPCFLGEGSRVENSVIGPHVSLGEGSKVENSILKNCLIQQNTSLENQVLKDSMIGSFASVKNKAKDLSVGDFTSIDDAL